MSLPRAAVRGAAAGISLASSQAGAAAKAAIVHEEHCSIRCVRRRYSQLMSATNTRRMSSSDRLHDSLRLIDDKISIFGRELELG